MRTIKTICGMIFAFILLNGSFADFQINLKPSREMDPAWSPNCNAIIYSSDFRRFQWTLYLINIETMQPIQLTFDSYCYTNPAWSRDGTKIACSGGLESAPDDIYIIPSTGGEIIPFHVDGYPPDKDPCWSPDGSKIAFTSEYIENTDIYAKSIITGSITRLTNDPAVDCEPCYSPDGQWIVFTSNRGGNWDIWKMPANGGNATRLTFTGDCESQAAWSSDGNWIAYTKSNISSGDSSIWKMRPGGSMYTRITTSSLDSNPTWAPDNNMLAYCSTKGWSEDIWILKSTTGTTVQSSSVGDIKALFKLNSYTVTSILR